MTNLLTKTIISNLILNETFTRKVLPYILPDYFSNPTDKLVFNLFRDHILLYNRIPNKAILDVELEKKTGVDETTYKESKAFLDGLNGEIEDLDWMVNTTEEWCKDRAIYNALSESLAIAENKRDKSGRGSIVKLLEDAISVSFDSHVGHDFLDDSTIRYDYYHRVQKRIPFDIDILNRITNGGLPDKSLTVVMGGVGVGKTACLCHFAAANMLAGKNVLYITLEMSEEGIAERIDANLLDVPLEDLRTLSKERYESKISAVKEKTPGRLVIKEFPTGSGNANDFRHLLHELKIKKKFRPDIIYLDYLNICSSSRIRLTANVGMYSYVKSIAEEIRGLAVEYDLPIVSATQMNREGYTDSDPGMEHIAESFGLPATADFIFVILVTEELKNLNQLQGKQIKNRFADVSRNTKFILGRDLSKMRLYNVDNPTDNHF